MNKALLSNWISINLQFNKEGDWINKDRFTQNLLSYLGYSPSTVDYMQSYMLITLNLVVMNNIIVPDRYTKSNGERVLEMLSRHWGIETAEYSK